MDVAVLCDNNTLIDRYFQGEPGFSAFVEQGGARVLFDLGYSGLFAENARRLGIDLGRLDYVAISHGHLDHTWGLDALARLYAELEMEGRPAAARPRIVAHPKTFASVRASDAAEIGPLFSERKLEKHFPLSLRSAPQWLGEDLVYLGQIPRENGFEGKRTFGVKEGESEEDSVPEDSALACRTPKGLVIVTGCSHAGICNIVERAKRVCGEDRLRDVIGGFHLLEPSPEQMAGTLDYFSRQRVERIHPCHCTSLKAKIALASVVEVEEVGVGTRLRFD
jgi:7,8-dihydropterin-6-yl-methyl-4-(beta-D-ribofuranosyl)aminobenzene 5'-phosphate synthase